jgi:hypothetical protein
LQRREILLTPLQRGALQRLVCARPPPPTRVKQRPLCNRSPPYTPSPKPLPLPTLPAPFRATPCLVSSRADVKLRAAAAVPVEAIARRERTCVEVYRLRSLRVTHQGGHTASQAAPTPAGPSIARATPQKAAAHGETCSVALLQATVPWAEDRGGLRGERREAYTHTLAGHLRRSGQLGVRLGGALDASRAATVSLPSTPVPQPRDDLRATSTTTPPGGSARCFPGSVRYPHICVHPADPVCGPMGLWFQMAGTVVYDARRPQQERAVCLRIRSFIHVASPVAASTPVAACGVLRMSRRQRWLFTAGRAVFSGMWGSHRASVTTPHVPFPPATPARTELPATLRNTLGERRAPVTTTVSPYCGW